MSDTREEIENSSSSGRIYREKLLKRSSLVGIQKGVGAIRAKIGPSLEQIHFFWKSCLNYPIYRTEKILFISQAVFAQETFKTDDR